MFSMLEWIWGKDSEAQDAQEIAREMQPQSIPDDPELADFAKRMQRILETSDEFSKAA